MLILNGCGTSIHFLNDKNGRKISRDNAPCILSYKRPFGFHILAKQTDVCYRYTDTFNVNENVNDNKEWLNDAICIQYLHA